MSMNTHGYEGQEELNGKCFDSVTAKIVEILRPVYMTKKQSDGKEVKVVDWEKKVERYLV